jgi:hypothetical protein
MRDREISSYIYQLQERHTDACSSQFVHPAAGLRCYYKPLNYQIHSAVSVPLNEQAPAKDVSESFYHSFQRLYLLPSKPL